MAPTKITVGLDSLNRREIRRPRTRQNFSKEKTGILRSWIIINLLYPYPSSEKIDEFVQQTELTREQVNQWFVNYRRRYLAKDIIQDGKDPEQVLRRKPKNEIVNHANNNEVLIENNSVNSANNNIIIAENEYDKAARTKAGQSYEEYYSGLLLLHEAAVLRGDLPA